MTRDDKNRRDFFRVFGYVPASVRRLDPAVETAHLQSRLLSEADLATWHELKVKKVNLSGRGVFFEAYERYQLGDILEIKLFLEQVQADIILAYGEVVRVENYPNHSGVAVKFFDIDERVLGIITAYVLHRERELISEKRVGWL
ncbi:MAG: type IV pilus assembly protein PilZ [Nitrospirae bacterium]|nr:MAG: type IV pilus assembly protein PilZ [Nitrospirota bacterium]